MIKKISKIMWLLVIVFTIFSFILVLVNHNDILAVQIAPRIIAYALFLQIILSIINFFNKNKINTIKD